MIKTNKNINDSFEKKIVKAERKLIVERKESKRRQKEFDKKYKTLMRKCRKTFIRIEINRAKRIAIYTGKRYLFPRNEIAEIRKVFTWP